MELNHRLTLILLDFFWEIESVLMIHLALCWWEYIGILLVPHRISIFFMDDGKGKLMSCCRSFSMWSPPLFSSTHLSELNIYSIHLGTYLGLLWWSLSFRIFIDKTMGTMIFNPVRFIKTFCWNESHHKYSQTWCGG